MLNPIAKGRGVGATESHSHHPRKTDRTTLGVFFSQFSEHVIVLVVPVGGPLGYVVCADLNEVLCACDRTNCIQGPAITPDHRQSLFHSRQKKIIESMCFDGRMNDQTS